MSLSEALQVLSASSGALVGLSLSELLQVLFFFRSFVGLAGLELVILSLDGNLLLVCSAEKLFLFDEKSAENFRLNSLDAMKMSQR